MNEDKKEDEIYCPECGKPVKKNAVVCPHCGIQIKELAVSAAPASIKIEPAASPKSKTVSVVIAVFFGFWSWLYTYRRDQIKFWIFLGILITMWISYIGYACSSVAETLTDYNFNMASYESNIHTFSNWIFAVVAIGWFWALIDAVRRPTGFYLNYPNG
jgi:hypothetical protein